MRERVAHEQVAAVPELRRARPGRWRRPVVAPSAETPRAAPLGPIDYGGATRIRRTMVAAALPAVQPPAMRIRRRTTSGRTVVQRRGVFSKLHLSGWKYSGGTMATQDFARNWHGSVFKLDGAGGEPTKGLWFDGFHLTNGAHLKDGQPHVFYSHAGVLDGDQSRNHVQSKRFAQDHSADALEKEIKDAGTVAPSVVGTLGPNLTPEEESKIEADLVEKDKAAKEKAKKEAEEEAAKVAAAKLAMEQSADRDVQLNLFLNDIKFSGMLTHLKRHLAQEDGAPFPMLRSAADWFVANEATGWKVEVPIGVKAKAPTLEAREGAAGKLSHKSAGKGKKNYTAVYSYSGYGTFRNQPGFKVPSFG